MTLATDLQDDIAELLDDPDIGRTVTIERTVPGTYDPATGAVGTETTPQWTTRGLLLNYKDQLVNGTDIKTGDRRLYLKLKGMIYEPEIGDKVTAGADIYMVINHKRIELAGTNVIFILQVRH